jgi:ribose 5-phosphate isomerase B
MSMDNGKLIFIASDHNGNAGRGYIQKLLQKDGYDVRDLGPDYDQKVDYPFMATKLAWSVIDNEGSRGILLCGTGTGMLIAANRFPKIRAGLATDRATAELMRQHNDCNVLVLGQWRTPLGQMDELVKTFLETPFEQGRHISRVEYLEKLP